MAVAYMRMLEQEPSQYEAGFTVLTKGVNLKVHDWILTRCTAGQAVLEVGCGPGALSVKMASVGCAVTAIDANPAMIDMAMKVVRVTPDISVDFQVGTAAALPERDGGYDSVVTTFLLSELGSLAQQEFLRAAWFALKTGASLFVAEEFVPAGIRRVGFALKRWWYLRKLKRHRVGLTHPLAMFRNYVRPIGFEVVEEEAWAGGTIRALIFKKVDPNAEEPGSPGFYRPQPCVVEGIRAWGRVARCLLTGQIDHVPIEPGIYAAGHPTADSPVVVTANYYYTFFRVMRDLRGVDAWVLCVDSRGINVWCAARGGDFGNEQLVEAVQATGLEQVVSHRHLVLPQLAAGGVSIPELPPSFDFKVRYGPVWSRDLPSYLIEHPARKNTLMRVAKFTLTKRIEAGVTHVTFLLRKFLFWPSILALLGLVAVASLLGMPLTASPWGLLLAFVGAAWVAVAGVGVLIALCFPVVKSIPAFTKKGYIFGALSATLGGSILLMLNPSLLILPGALLLLFWLGLFETLSFSGYTMESSPRAIQGEYAHFVRVQGILLGLGIGLLGIGFIWSSFL
ncbi:MAG TPA: methyltransferase domain-containing protein [Candidatus Lokiarchaeia archaeon]|nr:methyltransferase domain-containing protein [Candidatus Lokiarchaeia archaeon]